MPSSTNIRAGSLAVGHLVLRRLGFVLILMAWPVLPATPIRAKKPASS